MRMGQTALFRRHGRRRPAHGVCRHQARRDDNRHASHQPTVIGAAELLELSGRRRLLLRNVHVVMIAEVSRATIRAHLHTIRAGLKCSVLDTA